MAFFPLLAGSFHINGDYMGFQWLLGLVLAVVLMGTVIYSKTDLLPALSFVYFLIQPIVLVFYSGNKYQLDELRSYLWLYSSVSMVCLIAMCAFGLTMGFLDRAITENTVPVLGVINSLYVIAGAFGGKLTELCVKSTNHLCHLTPYVINGRLPEGVGFSGFLNYAGMNGVLLCLSIPFLLKKNLKAITALLLVAIAIILSKSSIPYGVAAIVVGSYYLCKHQFAKKMLICLSLIPMFVGLLVEKATLFDSSYRFQAYKTFMGVWWRNAGHWFGTGLGTFPIIERPIQINTGFMVGPQTVFYWPTLHSDWLQIVFETGFVGLALALLLYGESLWRLYKKQNAQVFSMLCGIGASAIFDFPLRYFVTAFLLSFSISSAYLGEKPYER